MMLFMNAYAAKDLKRDEDRVKINIQQMQGNSFIHTRQDLRSQNELPEFSDLE